MVDFGNDYWHAMDKDKVEKITISPRELGISQIGDPWASLQTAVKAGASHVELSFIGSGRGSIQSATSVTPETVTKAKREDIRHFAKINNVTLSTHAAASAAGFAGLGERGFSDQNAEQHMREVRRAMEFAADTAEGGTVVIHTGEFPRSITGVKTGKFASYSKEAEEGAIPLVNTKTGEILGSIPRSRKMSEIEKDEKGNPIIGPDGKAKFTEYTFQDFVEKNKEKIKKSGQTDDEYFYTQIVEKEKQTEEAEQGKWRDNMERAIRQRETLATKQKELYELAKKDEKKAHYKAMEMLETQGQEPIQGTKEYEEYEKNPIKFIDKLKERAKYEMDYSQKGFEGHAKKLRELEEQQKQVKSMDEYAIKRTADNIGRLGVEAYEMEKARHLKKPLVIVPENIFPESYGSHPQELRRIIIDSRDAMTQQLVAKKGMKREEAEKIAADRIKATFDIGHANTWRKYFTEKDPDGKKFNKWLLQETDQLAKEGIIGNVHLTDNFGYEDEHLSPGMGNAPIEEFVQGLKKGKYTGKFVIEPGGQSEAEGGIFTALTEGWGHLSNSPMYRVGGGAAQTWTDVSGGYLGQTWSPRHVQGTYLPSKEWGFYSETPFE